MDDDSLGCASVLPVAEGGEETFELELPPANGIDYLRRVRLEAQSCPTTVTVELQLPTQSQKLCSNARQLSRSSAIGGNHVPLCSPAPAGYSPSLVWQKTQVAAFSKIRMRLCQEIAERKRNKVKPVTMLPSALNSNGWCRLCFGKVNAKLQLKADVDEGNEDGDNREDEMTSQSEDSTEPTPPLLSIIAQIDQDTLLSVLECHVKWFESAGFSAVQGQWFYALLAALEKPLLPESCSLIRSLARLCSNLRASLESANDVLLPQLNLLICLVGCYFEQTDMADTFS